MKIPAIITLLLAAGTLAVDGQLTGTWDLKLPDTSKSRTVLVQTDTKVTVFSRTSSDEWVVIGAGKIKDNNVSIALTNGCLADLKFDGDKNLFGMDKNSAPCGGSRIASLYICSNHSPTNHAASSFADMQLLTKEYNCTGWHVYNPVSHADVKTIEKLAEAPKNKQ